MPSPYKVPVKINGHEIPIVPSRADLVPINGYHKRRKGFLYYCEIKSVPDNAWLRITEYVEYMRKHYGKDIKLSVAITKSGKYLRYERETGVPLFIAEDGKIYTTKSAMKNKDKLNVTVRFLVESCGYKVKEKRVCRWI